MAAYHFRVADPKLLDDSLLDGQHAVIRQIGPELIAILVDASDLSDCVNAVVGSSEVWGSSCFAFVPVDRNSGMPDAPWIDVMSSEGFDGFSPRSVIEADIGTRLAGLAQGPGGFSETIWSVLAAQPELRDSFPLVLELPKREDPWYVAYLAAFGAFPPGPSPDALLRAGLRPEIEIHDLVGVERGEVETPSGDDLLARLREPARWHPRRLSLYGLAVSSAAWSQDLTQEPTWTSRGWMRSFVGSNIVVVYEPGSVADFCLLWMLRAAHGFESRLPLGIPATADVEGQVSRWSDVSGAHALRLKGIGRPWAITSLSVGVERLQNIADALGPPWQVVAAPDLMQAPRRPSVMSTDVTTFFGGQAIVDGWDPTARALLRARSPTAFCLGLRVRFTVRDRPLPPLHTLRGGDRIGLPNWRDGGFDTQAPEPGEPVEISWPTAANVLRAAVRDRGLDIRPSAPGRAVHAIVERMGDLHESDPLKDPWILEQLDVLALRRGMNWFRDRMRRLTGEAAGVPELAEKLEIIESHLEQMTSPGDADQQHELGFSGISKRLGAKSARRWLSWAEDRGLLIRGVTVECLSCGAKAWRTASQLSPPIECPGCGRVIRRPFPPDQIKFTHRASQVLLNVMQADGLSHVLCGSWWRALFRDHFYGIHLGAEFLDGSRVLGEADVVLLLADGRVALGECKRRAVGLTQGDIERIENLADRLDAAWTFYATPQWASECTPIWQELRRDLPDRRRFALTGEQLLRRSMSVTSLLGVDETAFEPWSPAAIDEHAAAFKDDLISVLDDLEDPRRLDDWMFLPQ